MFQSVLLDHLSKFAAQIGDETWKARLWLAIGAGLILLAKSTMETDTVEAKRA